MLRVIQYPFWLLGRLLLSLRYRVRVEGTERLRGLNGKCVVLPNHPGYTDPVVCLAMLWPYLAPRPMLFEDNFTNPLLWPIAKLLNAIPVPDLEQASAQARDKARGAVDAAIAALNSGGNVILWPAGHIQHDGIERLGGARATADILQAVPDATVVLVRTRGLWGSLFSWAQTAEQPRLFRNLFVALGYLAASLFFFMPRRQVQMTVEVVDRAHLPPLRRENLNPWLEEWYNRGGAETPNFVPYHLLWGDRTYEFPPPPREAALDLGAVKPHTQAEIQHLIEEKLKRPLADNEKRPDVTFDELGLDSLDRMELTLRVEQQFGFSSDQSPTNIGQLWALAEGMLDKGPPRPAPPTWFQSPANADGLAVLGETIPEAFVEQALRSRGDVVVADDLAGALTFERVLVGALLMSKRVSAIAAPNVGLLLPASVGGDLALLAIYLAGKLPVVLNWTTGPKNLAHAAEVMGLTHVLTSRAFIDRTTISVAGTEYVYLEEMRASIGKLSALATLMKVRWMPGSIRKHIPKVDPDQPAVVLFTSGSEKAPKAVPLTHRNILTDQRQGLKAMDVIRSDAFLGFLPMFHSFGLTVTGLLPLLTGLRCVHHPDPTDAGNLTRKVTSYRTTILVGTPTFVSYIVERARPGDLDSLRMIIVGAEKCPETLMKKCAELAPRAVVLEGYGITECSPVVSVNPPRAPRPGSVGKPLPGVEVGVIDLETERWLPTGQMGMLLVSGPTVFPGYLGGETSNPFKQIDGKRWYVTGDLGEIDSDGYIWFRGRLKRFLKAGGEMISLPALEEPLARLYPPTEKGPRVAVEGVELDGGGRRVVLFSTEEVGLREANARLLEAGFTGVMRLDEVRRLEAIPVLGTGKVDYKVLRAMIPNDAAG